MSASSACNCCSNPPPVRIVLQFASFDRACSNTCILRYGDAATPPVDGSFASPWDWLAGPFLTALSANASDSRTFSNKSDTYTYTSNWERTTNAFLELNDFNEGNTGPYDCPCTHGYSDIQSSDRTERYVGEDGNYYEVGMSCNGGGTGISTPNSPNGGQGNGETQGGNNCPIECPPYLDPVNTATFGASGPAIINYTSVQTENPQNNDTNYDTTTTCSCEEPCQCPVPYPWNSTFPDGPFLPIDPNVKYYGKSAQCGFADNDKNVTFPPFPVVVKLTPTSIFDSGFITEQDPNLPQNQGYASTTFRYARGTADRPMQQSEQHVKWRIAHNPTSTCYLKVWLVKKKTVIKREFPDTYVPPTITWEDAGFYEWNGIRNTCLNDNQSEIFNINNIVYGAENIMNLPQPSVGAREYGIEEEIFIKKVSVIRGYEPPDPPAYSIPPELIQCGFATHDITIDPLDCQQCGLARSQGGNGSEDWWCAYKFLPLPDGCVIVQT